MELRRKGFIRNRPLFRILLRSTLVGIVVAGMAYLALGWNACRKTIEQSRETVLKSELLEMRRAIDSYTLDQLRAPQELQELVTAHYLREIPTDPFTMKKDWKPFFSDNVLSPEQIATGIGDVHSSSERIGSNGRAYSDW